MSSLLRFARSVGTDTRFDFLVAAVVEWAGGFHPRGLGAVGGFGGMLEKCFVVVGRTWEGR